MANLRQSILIRADLNLPTGLLAAQVAHLHMESLRSNLITEENKDMAAWLTSPYVFVHSVPNKEVLGYFEEKARNDLVPVYEWYDTINMDISPTFRKVFEVLVGITLGPCDSDKIKKVIGDLPLLK